MEKQKWCLLCQIDGVISPNNFQLNVDSNPRFHWFCFTSLCDWSGKLAPLPQQIRTKTKTSHDLVARVFPHFIVIGFSSCAWFFKLEERRPLSQRSWTHFLNSVLFYIVLRSCIASMPVVFASSLGSFVIITLSSLCSLELFSFFLNWQL